MSTTKPVLSLNDIGDDVKLLQDALNAYNYHLAVDGIFGSKTETAVKDFQKRHGLDVDGIVGPKTWAALEKSTTTKPVLSLGDTGDDVKLLQEKINAINAHAVKHVAVDGIFGPETEAAVKDIQKRHGLDVDGIVGPKTWAAIEESIVE